MLLYQGTQPGRSQGANTANQGFFLQSLHALVFEKGGQASELSTGWDGKPQIGDRWLMNRAMLSIGMHHKKKCLWFSLNISILKLVLSTAKIGMSLSRSGWSDFRTIHSLSLSAPIKNLVIGSTCLILILEALNQSWKSSRFDIWNLKLSDSAQDLVTLVATSHVYIYIYIYIYTFIMYVCINILLTVHGLSSSRRLCVRRGHLPERQKASHGSRRARLAAGEALNFN